MTRDEAYDILCDKFKSKPVVVTEYEYPEWWAFRLAPPGTKIEGRMLTTPMFLVDQETKEVLTEDDVDYKKLDIRRAADLQRQYLIDEAMKKRKEKRNADT